LQAEKDARKALKQAKLDKIKGLKAEGKWLSKADLEKKQIAEQRKQQMIAAGLIPNHAEDEEDEEKKPTGSMVTRKRK
jgi:hypothetical protein